MISCSDFTEVSNDMYSFRINENLDIRETGKEIFLEEKVYLYEKRIEIYAAKNLKISIPE